MFFQNSLRKGRNVGLFDYCYHDFLQGGILFMSNTSDVKFFTAEGIKKMEEELDYLRSVKRGEVAEKIKVARSFGDLSENAEYDEARKEQSFMEGRIQELEYILSNAQVIREEDLKSDVVNVGSVVTVYNETRKKEQVYSLVGSSETDPLKGKISQDSPIGAALTGHHAGETVQVTVPSGVLSLRIEKITR